LPGRAASLPRAGWSDGSEPVQVSPHLPSPMRLLLLLLLLHVCLSV